MAKGSFRGSAWDVKAPPSKILHVEAKKLLEAAVQMQLDLMYSWAMKRWKEQG